MRFTALHLQAFRSCVNLELSLDAPRVFVAGTNAAGKTSVREAVKWALTGRCQGLDGKGAGVECLVPMGANGPRVSVALNEQRIGAIARVWTPTESGFLVQGFTGPMQAQQQALYAKLKTDESFLAAVLDSSVFVGLHHAEAKALILSLLNVRIRLTGDDHEYTLEEIESLYQQAYEDRKLAKRELAKRGVPEAPPNEEMPTAEAVEGKLTTLRETLRQTSTEIGTVTGRRQELARSLERLCSKWSLKSPVSASELTRTDMAIQEGLEAAQGAVQEAEERLSLVMDGAQDAETPVEAAPGSTISPQRRLTVLNQTMDTLKGREGPDECVLDPSIPCSTKATAFARWLKKAIAERDKLDSTLSKRRESNGTETPSALKQAQTALTLTQRTEQLTTLRQEEWLEERKQIQGLQADLSKLEDTSFGETAISNLKDRIANGERVLRDVRAYWQTRKDYEKAVAEHKTREEEVGRLETLVDVLGPKGVRQEALDSSLKDFEAAVNPYTKPFGWAVAFQLDPWDVLVNERPLRTYSRSEQHRLGIAVQLAIAEMSGLSFAVIDEVDMLDDANRTLLTKMLLAAPLEQIVILATREAHEALPKLKGVLAYRLEQQKGLSVVVETSGA